jgi:hypothetical protein
VTEPMQVAKHSQFLPISAERLAVAEETKATFNRWMSATPEQRAECAREADQRRRDERRAVPHVPITLDALLARVDHWGWSREYVEHLVQPYCECEDGYDGWEYCSHARDLGFAS